MSTTAYPFIQAVYAVHQAAGLTKLAGDWDDPVDILEGMGIDALEAGESAKQHNARQKLLALKRVQTWDLPQGPDYSSADWEAKHKKYVSARARTDEASDLRSRGLRQMWNKQDVRKAENRRRWEPLYSHIPRHLFSVERMSPDLGEQWWRESLTKPKVSPRINPRPVITESVGKHFMNTEMKHYLQDQLAKDRPGRKAIQQQAVSNALAQASRSGGTEHLADLPLAQKLLASKWTRDLSFENTPDILKALSKVSR